MAGLTPQNIDDFIGQMDIWAWECDADLKLCYLSDNFERITGTPSHELLGLKLNDIAQQLLPQSERRNFENTTAIGAPINHLRFPWKARGKKMIWHEIYGYPLHSDENAITGYRGYGKGVAHQTRDRNNTVRTTLQTATLPARLPGDGDVGTWTYRFADHAVGWCHNMYALTGLPQDRAMNLEQVLALYSAADRTKLVESKRCALEKNEPLDVVMSCQKPDGTTVSLRTVGIPDIEKGVIVGFSGYCQEVHTAGSAPGEIEINQDDLEAANLQKQRRQEMRKELLAAIGNDEIVPFYQPVIDLKTGVLSGLESFARWQHPEKGLISAGVFMDLFENDQKITEMGQKLLDTILRDMAHWRRNNLHFGRVGYNVAAADLRDPHFADTVIQMLQSYELKPRYLVLEVRDEALEQSMEDGSVDQLKVLRAHGVSIAFRSSGARVYTANERFSIPFNILKIGGDLVRNSRSSDGHAAIVRSMISMGKELGYTSVAEGVETQSHINDLTEWGCERAQGYFFRKPLSAENITENLVDISCAA